MTSLSPSELLKYVRVQMAAEALYTFDARKQVGDAAGTLLHPGDVVKDQSISPVGRVRRRRTRAAQTVAKW